jgi:hypothetical protein
MNVSSNIEARSCNHCCSGKAISITHAACVCCVCSLSYPVYNKDVPYYIAIRGLSASTNFSTLSPKRGGLKKKYLTIKCFFYFLYKFCLKHSSL